MTEPLDRVIDEIASGLTAGEPRPHFRARVLDRVSAAGARQWPAATAWWFRAGAAAAAMAIVAIVGTSVRTPRGPQTAADPARRADVAGLPSGATAAPDPAPRDGRSGTARALRSRTAAPALVEWRARAIPALAGIVPMGVADIQPEALSLSQLSVAPLGITPMVIEPIGDGGR
jgi:hypothetical protein